MLFGISAKTLSSIINMFSTLLIQELHRETRQCRLSPIRDVRYCRVEANLVTCAVAEGLLTVAKTETLTSSGDYNCVLMLRPQRNLSSNRQADSKLGSCMGKLSLNEVTVC